MNNALDDFTDTGFSACWRPVDEYGAYTELLNQSKDITDRAEDKLYMLAIAYLQQCPSGEFSLATLAGQDNTDVWNIQPLSELKQLCLDDETAKINAGIALKKALYKHGGFEMYKRGDGVNVYRM